MGDCGSAPRASRNSHNKEHDIITQGTFSFLPDFTDDQIKAQIQYCLDNDWPIAIEYTDDPHPRNTYWEMWGLPMFDIKDASAIMQEVTRAAAFPEHYIRVTGYDRSLGRATTALSFIVNRPAVEPDLRAAAIGVRRPPGEVHASGCATVRCEGRFLCTHTRIADE
jgi:ribulose-bisphosphate carboxylase small chain